MIDCQRLTLVVALTDFVLAFKSVSNNENGCRIPAPLRLGSLLEQPPHTLPFLKVTCAVRLCLPPRNLIDFSDSRSFLLGDVLGVHAGEDGVLGIGLERGGQILGASPAGDPPHELAVALRQHADTVARQERVEEGARRLALLVLVLDGPHVRAHHDLDPRASAGGVGLGVGHARRHVQHRADGDGLFKGAGVEVQEAWPRVAEGRGAGEGDFEGLF